MLFLHNFIYKTDKKLFMRGIGWQSLLAGMVVIVAIVAVSLIMLGPLAGFKLKDYLGLQPLIGTPGDQTFQNIDFHTVRVPEAYMSLIWDCNGDCRTSGFSPEGLCQSAGGWTAVFVDCDNIDATGDLSSGYEVKDLSTAWDKDTWGWCHNKEGTSIPYWTSIVDEDMSVTCFKGTANVKPVLVDCKATDCKRPDLTPEQICTVIGSGWHAYAVDCDIHIGGSTTAGSAFIRDFTADWNGANVAWCGDTNDDDMVVFCVDDNGFNNEGFNSNDYRVLTYKCNNPPSDCDRAIDSSPDALCQKNLASLGGDWRATSVDCRYISIAEDKGTLKTFERPMSGVWGKFVLDLTDQYGGFGWCLYDTGTFDMSITCKREKIEYQCNNGIDDDSDGFCDLPTSACTDGSTPGDPGCYSDIDDDESDLPKPNMELGVLVKECAGNCYDKFNLRSPTDWCAANPPTGFGAGWEAINLECDNLGVDNSQGFENWTRDLNQMWDVNSKDVNNIKIGWCQDGEMWGGCPDCDEDVAITCVRRGPNNLAGIKVVINDCNGECKTVGNSPTKLCEKKLGAGWVPFGVDCDILNISNRDQGVFVRTLGDQWIGNVIDGGSKGWCQDSSDEDMAVFCTDAPINPNAIKVVIVNCWGDCYKIAGWSADRMCKDALNLNYRAIMVDTTNTEIIGYAVPEDTPAKRYFYQPWSQDLNPNGFVGWARDSGEEDVAIFCVLDSFSLFV